MRGAAMRTRPRRAPPAAPRCAGDRGRCRVPGLRGAARAWSAMRLAHDEPAMPMLNAEASARPAWRGSVDGRGRVASSRHGGRRHGRVPGRRGRRLHLGGEVVLGERAHGRRRVVRRRRVVGVHPAVVLVGRAGPTRIGVGGVLDVYGVPGTGGVVVIAAGPVVVGGGVPVGTTAVVPVLGRRTGRCAVMLRREVQPEEPGLPHGREAEQAGVRHHQREQRRPRSAPPRPPLGGAGRSVRSTLPRDHRVQDGGGRPGGARDAEQCTCGGAPADLSGLSEAAKNPTLRAYSHPEHRA